MPKQIMELNLSKEKILKYYKGSAKEVVATSVDGKIIRFPINILRKYVSEQGIIGTFSIEYDYDGKFIRINRINKREP